MTRLQPANRAGQSGYMRQKQARRDGCVARCGNRRDVVVRRRVTIERKPVTDKWKPIGKVETAEACARIVPAKLDRGYAGSQAYETLQKGVQGDGRMAFTAPKRGTLKSKFEIVSGSKADLLDMYPGISWICDVRLIGRRIRRVGNQRVTAQRPHQELVTKRPRDPREQRHHRAAQCG